MKSGYSLVRKWNALPPDQRSQLQAQGRRTAVALMAVKTAATAARSASDPPADWGAALALVSSPGQAERMAQEVVAHLQRVPEATSEEIATAVGAAGKDDSTLKRAMQIARDDGYIRRVGVNFHGIRWDTTEWADLELLDTPHVRKVEDRIVAFVGDHGLVSLDHVCGELGLEDDAPELRAALERAVSAETVHWHGNGIYGLSALTLDGFEPKRDLWAETKPPIADRDVGSAIDELEEAVKGLAAAMQSSQVIGAGADQVADESEDPYDGLRRVQQLHQAGVLTDQEFAAKKSELLSRI